VTDRPAWAASAVRRHQAALIPLALVPLIAALGRTWRLVSEGADAFECLASSGQPPIIAVWHGRLLPGILFWRDRGIVVIISENFDGEWIARVLARFGFAAARGSSSRGAVKALVGLKRALAEGRATAVTPDGPRGPAEQAQAGVIWLAKATGRAILPFHIEASAAWTLRSWDRAMIPKPFARVAMAVGPPFLVAPDVDDAGLEQRRLDLEVELRRLRGRALDLLVQPAAGRL